jgi:Tfp pilus assembly protein PilV
LRLLPRNQRGDTIVEVLIAVAVVSLVLAGSYAIANRNLRTIQDTQEHAQALQLAQREVEGLRALAGDSSWSGSLGGSCITGVTPAPTPVGACASLNSDTTPCAAQPCYKVDITSAVGIYKVAVTWESISGGDAKVTLDYGI